MTVRFLDSVGEVDAEAWCRLVDELPDRSVFCLPAWASAWWPTLGEGRPRVAVAEDAHGATAVAPFFESGNMLFLIGCVGADRLDIAWDRNHDDVLEEILAAAFTQFPHLVGLQLHQLDCQSDTVAALGSAASKLDLTMTEEQPLSAPCFDLTPDAVAATTSKKSLRRHENWFRRNGDLRIDHLGDVREVGEALPSFFDQHIRRWADTPHPSLFEVRRNREFFERLVPPGIQEDWLRFTRIRWNDRPIAYHYGFCLGGRYLWYKPSFEIDLAEHSPGEVLLRYLIRAAADEGASVFDFGIGDEAFKDRFADSRVELVTVGIYPGGEPSC